MDMDCEKCGVATKEYIECDSCDVLLCLDCSSARKLDMTSRKGSKCLRVLCPDCRENKYDRLKEITKLLYKIDLFNQQQKETQAKNDDVMVSFSRQLKTLELKMNALETGEKNTKPTKQNSYANAVKQNIVKPAVIVKPKNKQESRKTREEICNKVDKSMVNVCGTRNARDGGVVLRCENAAETQKVKQLFDEKLGAEYEVVLPKAKCPRLRITNIDADIQKDDILTELKNHNSQMERMNMKLIAVIRKKHKDSEYNDIIIEVDGAGYKKLKELEKVKLPWRECKIFDHLYIIRCYKCCGFFHKSVDCKINQKCHKCSGPHKFSDCHSKKDCCINCKLANVQYNMKLDTNHSAWSANCPVLKRHQSKLANKIDYNSA